jgi:hypothetical protein
MESAIRILRSRPEFWFFVTVIASGLTSFTSAGTRVLGPAVIRRLSGVTPDPILPFTLSAALVSAIIVWWQLARLSDLSRVRRFLITMSICVGPVGAFEVPYQAIRGYVFASSLGGEASIGTWIALGCWILVGLTGIGWMRVTRRTWILAAAMAIGFLGWWAVGYPQVTFSTSSQVAIAYLFNVPLKFGAFALFVLPLVDGLRSVKADAETDSTECRCTDVTRGITP